MAKYLLNASYTLEGVRGLLKEGGTSRRAAVEAATKEIGGSIEAFYFTFGQSDVIVIADIPDNVAAAALALTVSASGAVNVSTTVLLTPDQVDEATQKSIGYRAPGA